MNYQVKYILPKVQVTYFQKLSLIIVIHFEPKFYLAITVRYNLVSKFLENLKILKLITCGWKQKDGGAVQFFKRCFLQSSPELYIVADQIKRVVGNNDVSCRVLIKTEVAKWVLQNAW